MTDDARRLYFILATMGFQLLLSIVSSLFALGWVALGSMVAFILLLFVLYIIVYRDCVLLAWLLLGLASGWFELIPDAWLVKRTHSLDYPPEWKVWDSPLYMPFDWAVVIVQLIAIGVWLRQRMPLAAATLLIGLIGGLFIPMYEHLAKNANWWSYERTPMLWDAPYYVILAEFLLTLPLAWMGSVSMKAPLWVSVALGIVEGFVMLLAVWFTWWLVGSDTGAVLQIPSIG